MEEFSKTLLQYLTKAVKFRMSLYLVFLFNIVGLFQKLLSQFLCIFLYAVCKIYYVLVRNIFLNIFFYSYAPWCPACKGLQPTWREFATWSKDLGINVGQVDVTKSPGLSGRFMVTALPTIFQYVNINYVLQLHLCFAC